MSSKPANPLPPVPPLPRTLILDYRDSYTNNLLSLFVSLYPDDEVRRKVVVVQADEIKWDDLQTMLSDLDCILLSPGPGRPDIPADIGFALDLIRTTTIPLLGICLGMQALAVAYGGQIINTPDLKHGHVIPISFNLNSSSGSGSRSIFDLFPETSGSSVVRQWGSGKMVDKDVGNGKAPFGNDVQKEVQEEVQKEVQGEEVVGKGQGGMVDMVTYNSLTVDPVLGFPSDELEVIAWHDDIRKSEDGTVVPVKTIQGLAHRRKPQYGVQFHPESIASSSGSLLLLSFLQKTHEYHTSKTTPTSNTALRTGYPPLTRRTLRMSSTYRQVEESRAASRVGSRAGSPGPGQGQNQGGRIGGRLRLVEERIEVPKRTAGGMGDVNEQIFRELTRRGNGRAEKLGTVWLDGVSNRAATTSSMSIPSFVLSYSLRTRTVTCHFLNPETSQVAARRLRLSSRPAVDTFWKWFSRGSVELRRRLQDRTTGDRGQSLDMFARAASRHESGDRPTDTRWKGGWVGWWGYEMKEESLGGYEVRRAGSGGENEDGQDACWGWCDRLLRRSKDGSWDICGVVDPGGQETTSPATVQTTEEAEDDGMEMLEWLESLGLRFGASPREWEQWLQTAKDVVGLAVSQRPDTRVKDRNDVLPTFKPLISAEDYKTGIEKCRKAIYDGNSYELTLTTTFVASSSSSSTRVDPLDMYAHLRQRNPAPYSTFVHFPTAGTTILSSSPERFVRIDADGRVEMKPIKGTRGRVKCVCGKQGAECLGEGGPDCTARCAKLDDEVARELCSNAKERAENLMIVDLIRSDLQSCCSPSSVQVPKLIALETYESVHQLVTTVVGRLEQGISEIEAVERCFPPGSMTGAPKLRSVQILDDLEAPYQRRDVYSGALGYMGIDGQVDLSVVIRTIVAEYEPVTTDTDRQGMQEREVRYSLGAGGAITWLSDPQEEWDEVLTKVGSVIGSR
ncbi:putative 4-amino-4-deoxychorismate synthase [Filobasidium floriforme]|uniref:putative 4-amino-4-deoxychorismate synthase n=1 Tax=Filobasidium floriforme TaxID=5210 RepID=UPI001E8E39F6|nr:putative 4-amino-4-deoxychorismate synthase [Filobasidium floriforme]KAH8083726.1 putative 4-amino-4-deoxychorismate synthase [Filobasidium floriforme]